MKKAFSLIELFIAITLMGLMAVLFLNYTNYSFFSNQATKTTIQTQFSSITQALLHCKSLSDAFPVANDTLISDLECPTDPPYSIDGYDGFFAPVAPSGFSAYKAYHSGSEFYIQTSVESSSDLVQIVQDLAQNYSNNQYEYETQGGVVVARYYISR